MPPSCWSTSPSSTGARRPVALLPQTRRHALLAQLLRVPSIVFAVNKLDAVDDPAQAFAAVRAALRRFARRRRHRGRRHRAGVGAARRQRHAAAARALVPTARRCCSCWRACRPRRSATTAPCCCRCSTSPRDAATAPATSRARCGAASPTAACSAGDAVQLFPSRQSAPRAPSCAAPASAVDVGRGRPVGRPRARPPARRLARRLDRHARHAATRRSASRATLAWLDTEPAVVGRKYWVRHGNRWVQARITAIEQPARHPHAAAHRCARARGQRDRPRGRRDCSSRCRSSPTRQPRRRRADRRRPGEQPHQRRAAGRTWLTP